MEMKNENTNEDRIGKKIDFVLFIAKETKTIKCTKNYSVVVRSARVRRRRLRASGVSDGHQTWCTGMLVPAALKPSAPAV